jgi:hypothetical protein
VYHIQDPLTPNSGTDGSTDPTIPALSPDPGHAVEVLTELWHPPMWKFFPYSVFFVHRDYSTADVFVSENA